MHKYRIGLILGTKDTDYPRQIRMGVENTLADEGLTLVNLADLIPYHTHTRTAQYMRAVFGLAKRIDLDAVIVPLGTLFGYLENPYWDYLSTSLSRYSERTEYGHNADVQLRFVREKYNMNIGVNIQPQKSHYIQQYLGYPVDTVRTVANMSPTLNWRYRPNQQTNLQVTLRGNTQQPSITQLLDIYDDTNPLNITMGNPGLKPSFTTSLGTNFQMQRAPAFVEDSLGMQIPKQQRHWSFSVNGNWQRITAACRERVGINMLIPGSPNKTGKCSSIRLA